MGYEVALRLILKLKRAICVEKVRGDVRRDIQNIVRNCKRRKNHTSGEVLQPELGMHSQSL